ARIGTNQTTRKTALVAAHATTTAVLLATQPAIVIRTAAAARATVTKAGPIPAIPTTVAPAAAIGMKMPTIAPARAIDHRVIAIRTISTVTGTRIADSIATTAMDRLPAIEFGMTFGMWRKGSATRLAMRETLLVAPPATYATRSAEALPISRNSTPA